MRARRERSARALRAWRLAGPLAGDALAELASHARGHALTLLSLVWGAAATVLLLSLGAGFFQFLDLGFKKTGDRYSFVNGGYTTSEGGGARPGRRIELDYDDYLRVRASAPSAARVVGEVDHAAALVRTPRRTRTTSVAGATPEVAELSVLRVGRGRFFDGEDERAKRRVAVLGANLATIFYGDEDPLGRALEIEGKPFRVIGVLSRKGPQLVTNNALHDDMVFIPLAAAQRLFGMRDRVGGLLVDPHTKQDVAALHAELRAVLLPAHHVRADDTEAVQLQSITEFTATTMTIAAGLEVLLLCVGAGTLALAGVGVANLMVALVHQRRGELAVRRACGARRGDVMLQLLLETVLVVLGGGALGVALGAGLALAVRLLPVPEMIPVPVISPRVLLATFGVLVATGLVAGVVPARVASRVDPAAALRVA
jgi:putative ABC transport system permease protein